MSMNVMWIMGGVPTLVSTRMEHTGVNVSLDTSLARISNRAQVC